MTDDGFAPLFLEMGLGVDLVGEDMTKAACRAAGEAIGRTSLPGIGRLLPAGDRRYMQVRVTVAVPRPDEVDPAAVAAVFPYGDVRVTAIAGGLRMSNGTDHGPGQDHLIVAIAVVAVGAPSAGRTQRRAAAAGSTPSVGLDQVSLGDDVPAVGEAS